MGLLCLIPQSLYTGATTKKPKEALQEAEDAVIGIRQSDHMANSTSSGHVPGTGQEMQSSQWLTGNADDSSTRLIG